MTELSLATEADIPELLLLAEEFYNWSIYSNLGPFDKEQTRKSLELFCSDVNIFALILLRDDGKLIGAIAATSFYPLFYSVKTGIETFFYILPEYRNGSTLKTLLKAYRYWCKIVNCKFYYISKMVSSDNTESNKLRRI